MNFATTAPLQLLLRLYPSVDEVLSACALASAKIIEQAIDQRGHAFIAVSGGQSPIPLFHKISEISLPWHKVTVTLVDERWVPASHPDSNENLVRTHFLRNKATSANFIGWVSHLTSSLALKPNPDESAEIFQQAPTSAAQALMEQALQNLPVLDFALLGMGQDGHTASWFAQSPQLPACFTATQRCLITEPVTASYSRLTLSAHYLKQALSTFVFAPGGAKLKVLNQVLQAPEPLKFPVAYVFQNSHAPATWWGSYGDPT